MTHIKTILIAGISVIIGLVSCTAEADFNDRLTNLEDRVSKLEKLCAEMNTNISSLQGIVSALQNQDYITAVNELTNDGKVVGYTINFAKGQPITIYHGKDGVNGKDGADGKDGTNGKDGQNGKDGADGKDGSTPVIGVKQDTDGIWYWTLNGEWLLDDNGQKIKAVGTDGKDGQNGKDGQDGKDGQNGQDGAPGKDGQNGQDGAPGKDGQNGQDGKDGITPQLKIEEGHWYVSTDNGQTWTQLGKATGENGKDGVDGKDGKDGVDGVDGDSMFQSVTVTETEVTFVTSDGQTFVVKRASSLSIEFDTADLVVMGTNATRNIHYTITSGVDNITIEALSSADIKVKVVKTDAKMGTLQVKTGATIDEYSKVVVLVSNGSQAIMRTLNFEAEAIEVEENTTKYVSDEGGEITLEFFSNVPCHAEIPIESQSWISIAPETKAMEKQTINLIVQPNTGAARSATVTVYSEDGKLELSYIIEQEKKQPIKALLPNPILPDGIDKTTITEINFIVNSEQKTELTIGDNQDGYVPIYFEQKGTVINLYTRGDVYEISNPFMLFENMTFLQSLDLSNLIVGKNCTSMYAMFGGCQSLRSLVLGSFCAENIEYMHQMFSNCNQLAELDLSPIYSTDKVWAMGGMFENCNSLVSLNLSSFNTKNVTQMDRMFHGCSKLRELNLSTFNTSKVETMCALFESCFSLEHLDISSFSYNNCTDCYNMFTRCTNLMFLDCGTGEIPRNYIGGMLEFAQSIPFCYIRCSENTKNNLLQPEVQLNASKVNWVDVEEEMPPYYSYKDPTYIIAVTIPWIKK